MDEQQPELRWAPLPPQPKRTGRVWAIIGLVVAVIAIVAALLFFLLPRGDAPTPTESATPTPSMSSSPSPSGSPTAAPEPSETSVATPPPVPDPTIEGFRGQVSGWLNDAPRGLDIVAGATGQDALPVVDTLQQDAQRLSDAQPPSSIAAAWEDGVAAYAERLTELRTAISDDAAVASAVDAARAAAQELRSLVGL